MQQIGQKERYDWFVSDKIHFEKDGESIMIILSLLSLALGLAIIVGTIWLLFHAVFALAFGSNALALSITDSIKAKKFYAECKKRELGKPEEVSREKLNLVAELVELEKEPQKLHDIYLNFYRNDHRDEYPEYFAEKDKECSEKKEKNKKTAIKAVAYIAISVLGGALTSYMMFCGDIPINELTQYRRQYQNFWIMMVFLSLVLLIFIAAGSFGIKMKKEEKQKKEEEKKKLEEQINNTK